MTQDDLFFPHLTVRCARGAHMHVPMRAPRMVDVAMV